LKTRLWLFADQQQAVGLLLQELPAQQHYQADWERIEMLANTITGRELMELDAGQILHRLFHEEQVRLYDAEPVVFQCACSRPRIERTLRAMGREELQSIILERNDIEVGCEFCGARYVFDPIDVETLLANEALVHESQTKH